jgi:hypothetical protein
MIINNLLTRWLATMLASCCAKVVDRRTYDVAIGGDFAPYLLRWYLIPRNRFLNVYLHVFMRDDDDRALHDHPWWSASLLLGQLVNSFDGGVAVWRQSHMTEIYRDKSGADLERDVKFGDLVFRGASFAHRMVVPKSRTMTLFITGPRIRTWGFLCPNGWRNWREFTATDEHGRMRGCGET